MAANILPTLDRPRLRRWLLESAYEALELAKAARLAGNRPQAYEWLFVSRDLRVAALRLRRPPPRMNQPIEKDFAAMPKSPQSIREADADAYEAKIEACCCDLERMMVAHIRPHHSQLVMVAALMREAIGGALLLHKQGRMSTANIEAMVAHVLRHTRKVRRLKVAP